MNLAEVERLLTRELRVKEKLAARELAARIGLSTNGITVALNNLVRAGVAVRHPGSSKRGDRAPRYSKPSSATR